ncbi:probable disease resistance protein At1g63360 [Aegilops tauschii subsp. strangulata]|uniref:probable disease resistance protein At1g63360 n=1 Tax=Aegilops tauschii subsp. strangulata TaxID=200361 RepID=UPI003CC8AE5D
MWLLIKIIYHMITFKGAIAKLEEAAARAHGRPARLDRLRSACRHLRGVDSHLTRMHDFLESDVPGDDRLGVWGRRGAGKTSLLTPLRQPSPYHALFDRVLYLEVGSRWSVTDVQLGICCTCLGCSYGVMSSADDRSRACLILAELSRKSFLLLIDGPLEAPVDLAAVGPSTPLGKGRRRQKVVVSTRSPDMCAPRTTSSRSGAWGKTTRGASSETALGIKSSRVGPIKGIELERT